MIGTALRGEENVPHNFIKSNATSPNPGQWSVQKVTEIAQKHHGHFEHLWFDAPPDQNPSTAFIVIEDGDVDGLMNDLHGHELVQLYDGH